MQAPDEAETVLKSQAFKTPPTGLITGLSFQFLSDMANETCPKTVNGNGGGGGGGALAPAARCSRPVEDPQQVSALLQDLERRMQSGESAPEPPRRQSAVVGGADDDGEETVEEDRVVCVFYGAGKLGVAYYDEPNVSAPQYDALLFPLKLSSWKLVTKMFADRFAFEIAGRALDRSAGRIQRFPFGNLMFYHTNII